MLSLGPAVTISAIDELGANLEQAWRGNDYDAEVFPELATTTLRQSRLAEQVTPQEVVEMVFAGGTLPQQEDPLATFGQPPVTLFRGRRFYIDALFWVDGTTSIHQHGFSGAFCVLHGSSIETTFRFDLERNVDSLFKLGTLQILSSALLRQGDVRPIASGGRLNPFAFSP